MGRHSTRGRKPHRGAKKSGTLLAKAATDPEGDALVIELNAGDTFFSIMTRKDPPAHLLTERDGYPVEMRLDTWQDLQALLHWFRSGIEGDTQATLLFSTLLNKHQRAIVHRVAETTGHRALDTLSSGLGDQRRILVTSRHHAHELRNASATGPQDEVGRRRGMWLYKWAREHGIEVSCDEVMEALATGSLHAPLHAAMAAKDAAQAVVSQLCEAARSNDTDTIKALHSQHPHVFTDGVDMTVFATGETPQGAAARANAVEALSLLLDLGADAEQRDCQGASPLDVSRRYEQCEAEGVLLRAGVHDPVANCTPLDGSLHVDDAPRVVAAGGSVVGSLHATSQPRLARGGEDAASDVSTCHTDLLQHVGSLSALSVADFAARDGDDDDKLVDEPIPDATDDAVAALASIPSPRTDAKPCSASTTSSPSARASVASSARAPRVAFALPGGVDSTTTEAAVDDVHDAVALEVEESVCGTEAGTLDSIRSVCGASEVGSVDSMLLDVAAFASTEVLSAVPEDPEDPSSMSHTNGATTPATTTASDEGLRGFGSEQDLFSVDEEDGARLPVRMEVQRVSAKRPAEIEAIDDDSWGDDVPTLSELLWSLVPSGQQVEGWLKDPVLAGTMVGVAGAVCCVAVGVLLRRRR